MTDRDNHLPARCLLGHRGFLALGEPLFRRSETDGEPVMAVTLADRVAALPLRALQHELGIPEDSPDGRMLALIVQALDFVSALRLGDMLPREVCTGEASWEPDAAHVQLASNRLRFQLVAWLNDGVAEDTVAWDADTLAHAAEDPAVRRQVQEALNHAATALGLDGQEAVVALIEDMARELAFIEALRDRLLLPVQAMLRRIERMVQAWRGDASQMETLTQIRRLTAIALKQIARRFDELDAQTGEVMAMLRNADSQRSFIRAHRDWLYRSQLAWKPVLDEWDAVGIAFDENTRGVLHRTYHFLAPRFMPVTEWISAAQAPRKKKPTPQMVW